MLSKNSEIQPQAAYFAYIHHCVKSVQNGVFSGPYFPEFGLNTERYEVSLLFSPNAGKYGLEKTPYFDTFHIVFVFAITVMIDVIIIIGAVLILLLEFA